MIRWQGESRTVGKEGRIRRAKWILILERHRVVSSPCVSMITEPAR